MMNDSPDSFSGPVNIGNPQERTMLELAEMIIKLSNSKSKINFLPLPEDDPTRRKPDISVAQKVLNWQPSVALEDGLRRTIQYFDLTPESNKHENRSWLHAPS